MHKLFVSCLTVLLLCACSAWSVQSGEYQGISRIAADEKLGTPDSVHNFIYNPTESLYEYQGNLYEVLGDEADVRLIEVWWEADGETVIIWFRDGKTGLIAIDSLRYGKYVAF